MPTSLNLNVAGFVVGTKRAVSARIADYKRFKWEVQHCRLQVLIADANSIQLDGRADFQRLTLLAIWGLDRQNLSISSLRLNPHKNSNHNSPNTQDSSYANSTLETRKSVNTIIGIQKATNKTVDNTNSGTRTQAI